MNGKMLKENLIQIILFICAASSIGLVLFMVGYMSWEGKDQLIEWFAHGFGGLSNAPLPYMFNTIYVSLGGTLLGTIIGLPCAIYLAEFSSFRVRNAIKPAMEVLNGFPSIVMGMLVYVLLCSAILLRYNINTNYSIHGQSILAAWVALGIMSLPLIVSVSEDSLRAVHKDLRESSFGLGATKWQTVTKVLIPSAISGIFVSILLAFLNAMGETMAVLIVIGQQTPPPITLNPLYASNVITSEIASITSGGEYTSYGFFFGLATLLFILTVFVNLAVRLVRKNITNVGTPRKR